MKESERWMREKDDRKEVVEGQEEKRGWASVHKDERKKKEAAAAVHTLDQGFSRA